MGAFHISGIVGDINLVLFNQSHEFEDFYRPRSLWKHEQASEMMFDELVRENNMPLSVEDQAFVKALITGMRSRTYVCLYY